MQLSDLETELQARGFDYLTATRQDYFLNRSYQEICEEEDWPFLEASSTGVAPLAITDLRTIESVRDTAQLLKLRPLDRRNITDLDADLTTAGAPEFYYITEGDTVNVYPANTTDSLTVNYWKVPTDLSSATDIPLLPNRFHQVIVDGACAYAYFDSDNFEAAQGMLALWEQGKARMRDALLSQQHDEPDDYIATFSYYDKGWGY